MAFEVCHKIDQVTFKWELYAASQSFPLFIMRKVNVHE